MAEYDSSLYGSADITTMLEMLRTLSLALPQCGSVADAPMISAAQEQVLALLRKGSECDVPYTSFHGAMEMHADNTPDAPALVACDRRLSYGEFDRECNRIANALIRRGVCHGDRIVVLLPRRASLITAIYGAMKTGSAYIPCDPDYPAERIRLITEDSGAKFIITTADRVDLYPGKAVCIDEPARGDRRLAAFSGSAARGCGLHDLHIGVDRPSERCHDTAARNHQLPLRLL